MLGPYGRSRRHIQHAMPNAERAELQSSLLKAASYSAVDALLEVELRNGSVYQYSGVPASTYQNLLQAESKGRYFNLHIRNLYPTAKLI